MLLRDEQQQVAIDTLTYKFDVMRADPADLTEGPDDGIYCHGLWLEGARCATSVWTKSYRWFGSLYSE